MAGNTQIGTPKKRGKADFYKVSLTWGLNQGIFNILKAIIFKE